MCRINEMQKSKVELRGLFNGETSVLSQKTSLITYSSELLSNFVCSAGWPEDARSTFLKQKCDFYTSTQLRYSEFSLDAVRYSELSIDTDRGSVSPRDRGMRENISTRKTLRKLSVRDVSCELAFLDQDQDFKRHFLIPTPFSQLGKSCSEEPGAKGTGT